MSVFIDGPGRATMRNGGTVDVVFFEGEHKWPVRQERLSSSALRWAADGKAKVGSFGFNIIAFEPASKLVTLGEAMHVVGALAKIFDGTSFCGLRALQEQAEELQERYERAGGKHE